MECRRLGRTELMVSPISFGAFKIGRNEGIKYAENYALPSEDESTALLHDVLRMGINLIDTAPAYGLSEERIGRALSDRRDAFVLSSKVGERFKAGRSNYDFSPEAVIRSVAQSLKRLQVDCLDILLVHADRHDVTRAEDQDLVLALEHIRNEGMADWIGFSGKSPESTRVALEWADVVMVEYHAEDDGHHAVIEEARARDIGVLVKKGLASGAIPPKQAISHVLKHPGVCSMVVGSLNQDHLQDNVHIAEEVLRGG